jgi:uncharacterized protein YfbU (UPF0304 family)
MCAKAYKNQSHSKKYGSFGSKRGSEVLHLTDVERRILINQARILAALYPLEAPKFEQAVEVLSEGFHEAWEDIILDNLKRPLIKEEMNFIYQVLEMYDWLQKSFYALSFEEKVHLPENKLIFPGFCPKKEGRELAYARFLMGNLDRFAFLEIVNPLAASSPMRATYLDMLKRLPEQDGEVLSAVQLRKILLGDNVKETPNTLPPDYHDDQSAYAPR